MYAINRLCRELERVHTVQRICVENSHNNNSSSSSSSSTQCNMQRFLMWFFFCAQAAVLVHLYALLKMNMCLLVRFFFFCSSFPHVFFVVLFGSLGSRFFFSSFFFKWKNTLYTYRLTPSSCNDRARLMQPTRIKFVFAIRIF